LIPVNQESTAAVSSNSQPLWLRDQRSMFMSFFLTGLKLPVTTGERTPPLPA